MFLCYADESGFTGNVYDAKQPVLVLAGINPNLYNYHKSDSDFKKVFEIINKRISISELKGCQIYRGYGKWKRIDPKIRDNVIKFYINWIRDRNHNLIIIAIDNKKFFDLKRSSKYKYFDDLECPYLLASLHLSCIIQKINRAKDKNKGKTILVFDEQRAYSGKLSELIYSPPEYIDDYVKYDAKKESQRLNQIIDTAFFVRSHHSSMAQVADVVAYLFRLFLELKHYGKPEEYTGELKKVEGWINDISNKFMDFKKIIPDRGLGYAKFLREVKANGI